MRRFLILYSIRKFISYPQIFLSLSEFFLPISKKIMDKIKKQTIFADRLQK
ncbi:predicted protein [Enterococcus faecium 1,230,933]|nr:predicted protein [Enterococcus faecium 1,230,933]